MNKAGHQTQGDPVAPLSSICHSPHRDRSHRSVVAVGHAHSQAADPIAGCATAVIAEYGVLITTVCRCRRCLLCVQLRLFLCRLGRHRKGQICGDHGVQ